VQICALLIQFNLHVELPVDQYHLLIHLVKSIVDSPGKEYHSPDKNHLPVDEYHLPVKPPVRNITYLMSIIHLLSQYYEGSSKKFVDCVD